MKPLSERLSRGQSLLRIYRGLYVTATVILSLFVISSLLYYARELPLDYLVFLDDHVRGWAFDLMVALAGALAVAFFAAAELQVQNIKEIKQLVQKEEDERRHVAEELRREQESIAQAEEVRKVFPFPGMTLTRTTANRQFEHVTKLQILLELTGFKVNIDGDFGDNTEKIVSAAQLLLNIRSDGRVGKETWDALIHKVLESGKGKELVDRLKSCQNARASAAMNSQNIEKGVDSSSVRHNG
jgi:hypothetical protein